MAEASIVPDSAVRALPRISKKLRQNVTPDTTVCAAAMSGCPE
jgi:hypothetical protein